MNDLSARHLQMEEMKLNLGPAKGKDFATAIGPYFVTPDELEPFKTDAKKSPPVKQSDSKKTDSKKPFKSEDKKTKASAHLLAAVHYDEFKDLPDNQRPSYYNVGEERWVVVETGYPDACTFGNSGCITHGHVVRQIDEVR